MRRGGVAAIMPGQNSVIAGLAEGAANCARAGVVSVAAAMMAMVAATGTPAELTAQINLLVLNSAEPRDINRRAARLVTLGVPSAVFLADPAPAELPLPRTALNEPCETP